MEDAVCIVSAHDGISVAKFLQQKLDREDINVRTVIKNFDAAEGGGHFKLYVFIISPEFLAHADLSIIERRDKGTSILVLVDTKSSDLNSAGLENSDDWYIHSLEETDESRKELLLFIISLYENDAMSETSSDDASEQEINIDRGMRTETEETVKRRSPDRRTETTCNYIPERPSILFNAVKHVFRKLVLEQVINIDGDMKTETEENVRRRSSDRGTEAYCNHIPKSPSIQLNTVKRVLRKDDKVYLLLDHTAGKDLSIEFQHSGSSIKPDFIHDVYSYVFKWAGTVQETFNVNFKEIENSDDKICTNEFNTSETDGISDPSDSFNTTTANSTEMDDSPYDVLPSRPGSSFMVSFPSMTVHTFDEMQSPTSPESSILEEKSPECSDKPPSITAEALLPRDSAADDTISGKSEESDVPDKTHVDTGNRITSLDNSQLKSEGPSAELSHSGQSSVLEETPMSPSSSSETLTNSISSGSLGCGSRMTRGLERKEKLKELRLLLEEEISQANAFCRPTVDDHEAVLRHPKRTPTENIGKQESDQEKTERGTVCSTIEEERHEPETTAMFEVYRRSEKSLVSKEDIQPEKTLGNDEPTAIDKDKGTEDSPSLSKEEKKGKTETITDESTSENDQPPEGLQKTSRKPGFSFKEKIKKMMHRSASEPKMKVIVEAAQKSEKTKAFKSNNDCGTEGILAHSVSAGELLLVRQSEGEVSKKDKSTKKRKGKKEQRRQSLRIQRMLEDNNMTAPTLSGKPIDETF